MRGLLAVLLGAALASPQSARCAAPASKDARAASASPAAARKKGVVRRPDGKPLTLADLAPRWQPLPPALPAEPPPAPEKPARVFPDTFARDGAWGRGPEPGAWNTLTPEQLADLDQTIELDDGTLRRASLTKRSWGLTLEGGVLGSPSRRNDILDQSLYFNLRKRFESAPDSWVDYRGQLQVGLLDAKARFFDEDVAPDPQLESLAAKLLDVAEAGGAGAAQRADIPGWGGYRNDYKTTRLVVTSALGQVGRAYRLLDPVSFGWAVTGLVKTSHWFPNAAADLTVGPKFDLGSGRSVGLSGGVTGNASPAGYNLAQGFLSPGGTQFGLVTEKAPHAGVTYAGTVPGEPGLHLTLDASRAWNLYTVDDRVKAAITTDVGGKPTELAGTWRIESGPAVEFERNQRRLDLTRRFSGRVSGGFTWSTEDFRYGDARLNHDSYMVGLTISLDSPAKETVSARHAFSPRDRVTEGRAAGFDRVLKEFNRVLSEAIAVVETAQAVASMPRSPDAGDSDKNPERLRYLRDSIRGMDPLTKAALKAALLAEARTPDEAASIEEHFTDENLEKTAVGLDKTADVAELLRTPGLLERFATRAARRMLVDYLDRTTFPLEGVGAELKLDPGVLLAAMHTLNARPSPVLPVTAADQHDVLEPWAWRKLAQESGLPETATREEIALAWSRRAPPEFRQAIEDGGPAALTAFVEAVSSLVRKELNAMLLRFMVAAEELNRLSADEGRGTSEMGRDMLQRGFQRLKERELQDVLTKARAGLR